MSILEARGLRVPPAGEGLPAALPGPLDLRLDEGEILAITGASGSGKTTALRCLALLEPRAEGEVRFLGDTIDGPRTPTFRRKVVYLRQQAAQVPMRVDETLAEPFSFKSAGGAELDRSRASRLLERLLLPADMMGRWVPDQSVGEMQRLALARALLLDPVVLLLDEFTSALDSEGTSRAESLVLEWLASGERGAVLVSHHEEQTRRLATRSLRLEPAPAGLPGGGPRS